MRTYSFAELKERNPLFFAEETVNFHGDDDYFYNGKVLEVRMIRNGRPTHASYSVNEKGILNFFSNSPTETAKLYED